MNKEQRESILRQIMAKKYPILAGSLSIDFRRTAPRPEGDRKLFRAYKAQKGVKVELRCHPNEDAFGDIVSRAARAANEIATGTSNATEIGLRERQEVPA